MYEKIQKIIGLLLEGLFEKEDLYKFEQHYEERKMSLDHSLRAEFILGAREIGTEWVIPAVYVRRITDTGWYIDREPIKLMIIEVAIKVMKKGEPVVYLNDLDSGNNKKREGFMEELSCLVKEILNMFEFEELKFTRIGKTDPNALSVYLFRIGNKEADHE